jgi:hypothetical protein
MIPHKLMIVAWSDDRQQYDYVLLDESASRAAC